MRKEIPKADDEESQSIGLPWPRTWRGVYALALGCFIVWVAALWGLGQVFR